MDAYWMRIENLSVNINGRQVLQEICLNIRKGEQWLIYGAAASGKTVLAHSLAGRHSFQGRIIFPEHKEAGLNRLIGVVENQHRFLNLQNQAEFYYQQRYNAFDAEATITVQESLSAYEDIETESVSTWLGIFHLSDLLHEPLIQLSNGENKRLQILKAILQFPELLILDEPYTGLDAEGRVVLDGILKKLSARGQQMLLLTSRNHLPEAFPKVAVLEQGRLTERHSRLLDTGDLLPVTSTKIRFPDTLSFDYPDFQYAVRMRNVQVQYGEKKVLQGINWDLKKGEAWALTGANGAGKSTLLSLITADNPQAYSNEIYLFDRKRGSGESIWDIKKKTGFLSPELHLYFDPAATAFTALASGLFDTIGLFRRLNPQQEQLVSEWLELLGCGDCSSRLLNSLPAGIQRMILLGRAMIKTPPLLILDEPCQGLDAEQTVFAKNLIDQYCIQFGASLIYVSHYPGDFPSVISETLALNRGKIA